MLYYEGPDPKWKAYGELLKYADPASIDFKAITEKQGKTTSALRSYFRNLRSGPNVYKELLKAGHDPAVIPLWVHRTTSDDVRSTSEDQSGAGRTRLDQAESPGKATLKEGATETQPGGGLV
jgi:hypothetical protein